MGQEDNDKRWYVFQRTPGSRKRQRAKGAHQPCRYSRDRFGRILVPVEEVVEMKTGQKNRANANFSLDVLVEMEMTDETWHLVKTRPRLPALLVGRR
jgi:transcriptional antiterminator NusG